METAEQKKYERMTGEPVERLIRQLAVPTMIAMLVTAAYNIADTYFVGTIGTEATAGVGLILPVMSIIQAIGFFFGQGSGNFISRALGARNMENASKMAATGAVCAAFFGLVLTACGFAFNNGLLYILGAREGMVDAKTVGYARDYLMFILIGAPFMSLSCVLNNQLRFQGNAVFAMIGLVSGAVLNCGLDPLFIFGFHMEVRGAAMATMISQIISCSILYIGTLRSDNLKIKLKNFTPKLFFFKNICVGGLPSLFRQGLTSLSTLCLNTAAGAAVAVSLAEESIAAFSIVGKIMMLVYSALIGFGQGFQPVCGFNYGAGKYDRVWKGWKYCSKVSAAFLLILSAIGYIFAGDLVAIFRDDVDVIAFGTVAMRMQCIVFALNSVTTITNMMYQNMGRVVGATVLAASRQGILFIPIVLILPRLFEQPIWGVYLAQPLADVFAFVLAIPFAVKVYREFKAVSFKKS
ncbi:MAG: MATE family efflux transporter [Eubacteriales bacterium]|nr:MATE family efflux transporter [Eubacteriales bacterium]